MQKLPWAVAVVVFLLFFGLYSFRLGIRPELMHDDFEYTYPSFSLAERGNFGSPLLGPGFNIENRTYNLIVYYYATVHAAMIRLYGDGPESVPLANTLHFALLAAAGAFFLARRGAYLGLFVFLYALVSDERMVDAARHGRPEMTAAFGLTIGVLALWLWRGEGRHRPGVMLGMGAALTAGMLSHTSVVFFALALAVVFAAPLAREAGPREVGAGVLPFLVIPLLYGYFIATDSIANLQGQLAPAQGDVVLGRLLLLLLQGDWGALGTVASEFVGLSWRAACRMAGGRGLPGAPGGLPPSPRARCALLRGRLLSSLPDALPVPQALRALVSGDLPGDLVPGAGPPGGGGDGSRG